jgi:hypothetical protein
MGDTTTRMPDKLGRLETLADTGGWLSAGTAVLHADPALQFTALQSARTG